MAKPSGNELANRTFDLTSCGRAFALTGRSLYGPEALASGANRFVVLRVTHEAANNPIPHAAAHAEALILSASGHAPHHQFHEAHQLTREWTDADLDKVVDNRAGVKDAARDQRKR
ncbi:MAG: hypothetical protein E6Q31_06375 [Aquabacterium sp.]|nr:MAG: hypothetical protein E6Q31_06375 [Aquabacterium sp.]